MTVVTATQEAEAGESLEPGTQRLQQAMIVPLHSSLSNRSRLSQNNDNRFQLGAWLILVIPATQKAEAGELFEPSN